MEDTGRIHRPIDARVRRMLYGRTADALIDSELESCTRVDLAHTVMLAEAGLMEPRRAARLASTILDLRVSGFAPLRGVPAGRGLYLLLEDFLIATLGELDGGSLQLGRSRNDLSATTLRIRLRKPVAGLIQEGLRLLAVLLRRARAEAGLAMPGYTHYQVAQPITLGHYLSGIGLAAARDIRGLMAALDSMSECPLGAGALAGTALPIQPERTAELLGFALPVAHSLDAVASRDFILRLLSAAAIFGVTLSRLATDLLLWSTAETGLLAFPDSLSGSSSMMPQKRNAFVLEHIQGKSMAPLGAFTAAAAAMSSKPFTNSIAVGTEAASQVWNALSQVTDAVVLARLAVRYLETRPGSMRARAEAGYAAATACADALTRTGEFSFRSAHRMTGEMVTEAIARGGVPLAEVAGPFLAAIQDLSCESVASGAERGGGPGVESMAAILDRLDQSWRAIARWKHETTRRWAAAERLLHEAVQRLLAQKEVQKSDAT
jgi:argininosuccinate lyase